MSAKYRLLNRAIAFLFVVTALCSMPCFSDLQMADFASSKPFINIFKYKQKENSVNLKNAPRVFPGGMPIGFTIQSEGVIIVGISEVETADGKKFPAKNSGIINGDIMISIENEIVNCVEDIDRIINEDENKYRELSMRVKRGEKVIELPIQPAFDAVTNTYKLGIWIKDNAAGVGTVTYYTENGRFGALGHPVCDSETSVVVPVRDGTCYKCDIIGFNKSVKGKPGELKGMFLKNKNIIGSIDTNNTFGLFGNFNEIPKGKYNRLFTVAPRSMIKQGPAKILSTINNKIEEFDIEIVKTHSQKTPKDKGMVIKITDKKLLDKTGGIVQGMSGSPIIQGDFIIGAVTHVFVNDPTRGYGMFLDFMVEAGAKSDAGIDLSDEGLFVYNAA